MADEEIKTILEFDLNFGDSKKQTELLTDSILSLNTALLDNKKQQKDLQTQNKEINKQLKDGAITQDEANKKLEENNRTIKALNKEQFSLKDKMTELNRERRESVKVEKLQENSLNALRKRSSELKNELNNVNLSTKEGQKRFKELQTELKTVNDTIRKADQGAGDFKTNIGNYSDSIKVALNETGLFSGSLGRIINILKSTKAGLIANVVQMGILKTAIISTGIGALIVALGTLITFFTKTQRGADEVSKIIAAIGATIDVVIDRLSSFGEGLWLILSGKFSAGLDKLSESFDGIGEEILKEATSAYELEEASQKLLITQRELLVTNAQRKAQIESLRLVAEDETKSIEERIQALKKAGDLQNQITQSEIEAEKENLRILSEKIDLGETMNEDLDKQAELQAKIIDLEAERDRTLKRLQTRLNSLNREQETELNKKLEDELKANELQQERDNEKLDWKKEYNEELLEQEKELNEEFDEIENERLEKEIEITDKIIEQNKKLEESRNKTLIDSGKSILKYLSNNLKSEETAISRSYDKRQKNLEAQLKAGTITQAHYDKETKNLERQKASELYEIEKQQFKLNKISALSEVGIDTSRAIMKAVSESPLTFGLPWTAFIAGQGILQALTINSQPEPVANFAGGGDVFAKLKGKSHEEGGINFISDHGHSFQVEGDEGLFITSRNATDPIIDLMSSMNQKFGGDSFFSEPKRYYQSGGNVGNITGSITTSDVRLIVSEVLKNIKFQVAVEDIQNGWYERDQVINQGVIS